VQRHSPLDTERLQSRYGAVKRIESQLLRPVATRGAAKTRERIAMHEQNARLLATPTPEASEAEAERISSAPSRRDALSAAAERARELLQQDA
jgi:hypothetical protein